MIERIGSFWNLGRTISRHAQIPWGVRDRADGTVWYITASTTDGTQRIALNTSPPLPGVTIPRIYPAYSEPFLEGADVRLFVRSGALGFEAQEPHLYCGARLAAARISDPFTTRYELKAPAGFDPTRHALAFETNPDW